MRSEIIKKGRWPKPKSHKREKDEEIPYYNLTIKF